MPIEMLPQPRTSTRARSEPSRRAASLTDLARARCITRPRRIEMSSRRHVAVRPRRSRPSARRPRRSFALMFAVVLMSAVALASCGGGDEVPSGGDAAKTVVASSRP